MSNKYNPNCIFNTNFVHLCFLSHDRIESKLRFTFFWLLFHFPFCDFSFLFRHHPQWQKIPDFCNMFQENSWFWQNLRSILPLCCVSILAEFSPFRKFIKKMGQFGYFAFFHSKCVSSQTLKNLQENMCSKFSKFY